MRASTLNLMHPFQSFILGQKIFPLKVAAKYGIPLIFYGDNTAERGNPISENSTSIRKKYYHSIDNLNKIYLGGINYKDLINKHKIDPKLLEPFVPIHIDKLDEINLEVRHLSYYLKWIPQETYYYAVKNCGFKPRPFRTDGTYTKYAGIDDKVECVNFYTIYVKFGIGRAMLDSAYEIRHGHTTKEEGKALIRKFDGEYPIKYENDFYEYISMKKEEFIELCDKFRPDHIWEKKSNRWVLKTPL